MTALDAILLGFEAELELERELGTRTIPLDRKLLTPIPSFSVAENAVCEREPIVVASCFAGDNRSRSR